MTKAADLLEKLKQRREDAEAIKAYWEGVLPGIGNLPESQLQGWIQRFSLDTIIAGLNAAVIQRSKLDAKGEKLSVQEAVDYASGAMHDAHFEAMPEEERKAYAEKAAAISAKRSAAGKIGRAKQLAEGIKACQDFAQVCPDLPEVAQPLPNGSGCGFGGGVGSDLAFDSDRAAAPATQATPAAATQPAQHTPEQQRQEQTKTNVNTNPVGSSESEKTNQGKIKTTKTGRAYKPCPRCKQRMYRDENHVCTYPCTECYAAKVASRDELCRVCQRKQVKACAAAMGDVDNL